MSTPPLETKLADAWPPVTWADVTVLAAVSGGADSVALLRGLAALKPGGEGRLVVAHLNHRLRGRESDDDARFVSDLAAELGLACECASLEPGGLQADRDGLEAAARTQRYRFLTETAERIGARYVVCAHTADDQIETLLHRILRGTGIAGLAGIPRCRRLSQAVTLIRPLLEIRRDELVDYLATLGQSYREDGSNTDTQFTRNRIRHELLPHLARQYNPAVGEALLRLGQLAGEAQGIVDDLVAERIAEGVTSDGEAGVLVRRGSMADVPDYLVRELLIHVWRSRDWPLQSMGFEEWGQLVKMLRTAPGASQTVPCKRTFPGQIVAECAGEGLRLQPR